MNITIHLYDLSEENINEIYKEVFSQIKIKPNTNGIDIISDWGDISLELTFDNMVEKTSEFWLENDEEYHNHNLKIMKQNLEKAIKLIDKIIK